MKHFFKLTVLSAVLTASIFGLSIFTTTERSTPAYYHISPVSNSKSPQGANNTWAAFSNPTTANNDDATLEDVNHRAE